MSKIVVLTYIPHTSMITIYDLFALINK